MKNTLLTLILFTGIHIFSQEKPEIINSENNKLVLSNLKEGTRDYLEYFTDSTKIKRTNGNLWRRITKFKKHQNRNVVEFTWLSYINGKLFNETKNIMDYKTLAPIHHKAKYHKIGDERIDKMEGVKAYDYYKDKMVPSDSIPNNKVKDLGVKPLAIPIISWEQDLEIIPLLPIKKVGQFFDISFFDPSEKEAQYHRYKVIGKEKLTLNQDTSVNCWIVQIFYSEKSYSIFYLSQKSKEVLKMEEKLNRGYRYKVLQY